ncbi:MAG: hypothetical protein HW416_2281 [Chloroflexi bacterium]|nr:hypothetical protein [Chloroflexota bacterium]
MRTDNSDTRGENYLMCSKSWTNPRLFVRKTSKLEKGGLIAEDYVLEIAHSAKTA